MPYKIEKNGANDRSPTMGLTREDSAGQVTVTWWCAYARDVPSSQNTPTATERQRNGFSTGTHWKPVECWRGTHCWPVFSAVAGRCLPLLVQRPLLKMQRVLNLRLNLLNCNGFSTGQPLQPVGHPLLSQRVPFLMTNAVQRVILTLGTGATGDESR